MWFAVALQMRKVAAVERFGHDRLILLPSYARLGRWDTCHYVGRANLEPSTAPGSFPQSAP